MWQVGSILESGVLPGRMPGGAKGNANTVDRVGAASEYSRRGMVVSGLTVLLYSLVVAVVLGVLFSLAYPRTEVNVGLASLFALAALVIVLTIRAIWQTLRRKKA